jgi:hypothetical protein
MPTRNTDALDRLNVLQTRLAMTLMVIDAVLDGPSQASAHNYITLMVRDAAKTAADIEVKLSAAA